MTSVVTGISPKEGKPGTKLTIRGENFGAGPDALVAVYVCGKNCVYTAEWQRLLFFTYKVQLSVQEQDFIFFFD